ncbi:MAG: protein kinase [Polyangiaceae bacterium]|nr:protein kinase [Polyangiaceae bacterium]
MLFCPKDGTPLSSSRSLATNPNELDPYLGLELPGQITLQALVGIGSMGRVYRAFQSGIDRDVAVKILHRELTGNAELVTRFHREAKIASRLVHPNVVQVLLTGTLPVSHDGRTGGEVYLVMEYLDGISLLSALAAQGEGGALPLARALHVMFQLCDAVGEAHQQSIVHRDLKPENIMLVRRGIDQDFVKVLDFGIARLDAPTEKNVTQAGLIFGTAKYISPEGAEGRAVGPQADVYAIATILYQCLAGRTPFEGDTPMAVLMQQINGTPKPLKKIARASYVPDPIEQVIMGNLVKSADDRAENARAFGRELELAAREAGIKFDTMSGSSKSLLLASKQRTKQHEFTTELKEKIASMPTVGVAAATAGATRPVTAYQEVTESGGRAAPPAPPPPNSRPSASDYGDEDEIDLDRAPGPAPTLMGDPDNDTIHGSLEARPGGEPVRVHQRPAPTVAGEPMEDDPNARISGIPMPRPSGAGHTARPSNPGAGHTARPSNPGAGHTARPSNPGGPLAGAPRSSSGGRVGVSSSSPGAARSRPGDLRPVQPARPAGSHAPSPSDGVIEMDAPEGGGEPRRVTWRVAAVLLAIAVLVPVGAFGAARIWNQKPETTDEGPNVEGLLESAEEAMDRRAWDTPPGENVKELTDRALELSPGDRHVLSLRRTAADRILSEALGKKYAGSKEEALRLANLALSLNPDLAAAQALVKELETPEPIASEGPPEQAIPEPSAEPAASASAEPSASAAVSASAAPPTPSVTASATAPTPPPSGKPPQKGPGPKGPGPKPPSTEDPEDGPDLPPSNPPDITPPGPSSARPWM